MSDEGRLNFSTRKKVLTISAMPFVLPDDSKDRLDSYDFSGMLKGEGNFGWNPSEKERVYGMFSLIDLAADWEQNLYYTFEVTAGTLEEMENAGVLLCRRTVGGELSYWKYLPGAAGLAVDAEGRACVLSEGKILVFDAEGNQVRSVSVEAYQDGAGGDFEELFMDSEGRVYYCVRGKNYMWRSLELTEEGLQDAGDFMGSYTRHIAAMDGDVFLFSSNDSGSLYQYSREKETTEELLRWTHSGIIGSQVHSLVEVADGILLVNCGDGMNYSLYQLTRIPTEALQEKETLVLAALSNDSELQQAVMKFNESNSQYRILIDEYGAEFSESEGRMIFPMLDAALVSSNPPDLLDLSYMDIGKYAGQGALEDLSPYLESSSELSREDYLDNMLDGMTVDGKLLCIPLAFDLQVVAGRVSQVGDMESWSMEDVYRLTDTHPESRGGLINDGYGEMKQRSFFLRKFCSSYYLEKFVDWDSLECDFDCEEFCRLLAWVGDYAWEPEAATEQVGDVFYEWKYIPETALLVSYSGVNFEFMKLFEVLCGEDTVLLGFPTIDGKGSFPVKMKGALAICADSSHKEAAWEFIEYYLSNTRTPMFYFSTKKDRIQQKYQAAVTPIYNEGGDADRSEESEMTVKGQIRVGAEEYPYYVIPSEQADAILHAIETADFRPMSAAEEMIISIVAEEAESYFAGDKSLQEVTRVIQNRARLLLQEQKK